MDYQCDICFQKFTRKSDLKRHKQTQHDRTKHFTCDKCEKIHYRRDKYIEHCRICKIICTYCAAEFDCKSDLNQHVNLQHIDKKFLCAKCGKKYGSKRSLNNHKCKQEVSNMKDH